MPGEPHWLGRLAVEEAHFRLIRDHGGAHGLRDENALEAALARPRQRWHYQDGTSLANLAAAYGFGLARDHPFVDGNKRIGLVALVAFLDRNGIELKASNAEAVTTMLAVAAAEMTEDELAIWVSAHSDPVRRDL
ncbi:MAG: type II toxin-antitoxin system death-on-curing family toxin [Chloroflexi bacterium]|nr:type II toxin-antitoxin system death-on-curing family toxin [Chloroflexota bacterium]